MRNEKIMDIHLNQQPFGFITAWKDAYPPEENIKKNEQLQADIQYSGLSYIRATFVWQLDQDYETNVFCVIDNNFHTNDFRKLLVYWGDKYEQPCVLLTTPEKIPTGPYREDIGVDGTYYDRDGEIVHVLKEVQISDIERYFSKIIHQYFDRVSHIDVTLTETRHSIYQPSSAPGCVVAFKEKYPQLAAPKEEKPKQPWLKNTRVKPTKPTKENEKMADHDSNRSPSIELPAEIEKSVFQMVDSYTMRNYMKKLSDFTVYNWIELITGAPRSLNKKLRLLSELTKVPMGEEDRSKVEMYLKAGQTALERLYNMDPDKSVLMLDFVDTDPPDPFDMDVTPFLSYEAACKDMAYNFIDEDATLEDLVKEDDRQTYFFRLHLYEKVDGELFERYQYTCASDGKVQFYEKFETDEEKRRHGKTWLHDDPDGMFYGRDNLEGWETPFKPGDIIYIDMRPYFHPTYCLICWVNEQMPYDCCGTQCLFATPDGRVGEAALKHGRCLPYVIKEPYDIDRQYFSPLYRAELYTGPVPEKYAFMKPLSEKLKADPAMAPKVDDYFMKSGEIKESDFVYRPVKAEKREYWEDLGWSEGVSKERLFEGLGIED